MDIINQLLPDLVEFMADKRLDLVFIIKLIDYLFSELEINIENHDEVSHYIHSIQILNNLYMLFSLTKDYEPKEMNAFDNDVVKSLLQDPNRITKFREFRVSILEKYNSDLVPMFEEYRSGKF